MKTTIKNVTKVFLFEDENGCEFLIRGFNDGFVNIGIPIAVSYYENKIGISISKEMNFIKFISGCFGADSNFKERLFEAYGSDPSIQFNGFKLELEEDFRIITKENSSFYAIQDTIKDLVASFSQKAMNVVNKEIYDYNQEVNAINEIIDSLDLSFKSYQAEKKYAIEAEGKDEEFLGYGQDFVMYTQYLVSQKGYTPSEATRKTYEKFDKTLGHIEEGLEAIRFICDFCLYGDEIYKSYFDISMQRYNDELDYL